MESVLLGAALLVTLVALVIVILRRPGMPGKAAAEIALARGEADEIRAQARRDAEELLEKADREAQQIAVAARAELDEEG